MTKEQFIREIKKLNPSSTFLTIKKYQSESGEIADYNLLFNVRYDSLLESSITTLEHYAAKTPDEVKAKMELIDSFSSSLKKLEGSKGDEIVSPEFMQFTNNGKNIKGIKMHTESGALYLSGLVINKRSHKEGNQTNTNSSSFSLVKNQLREKCPVSKFRQFKITSDKLHCIHVQNMELLPPV
jgi:hypothetical protein